MENVLGNRASIDPSKKRCQGGKEVDGWVREVARNYRGGKTVCLEQKKGALRISQEFDTWKGKSAARGTKLNRGT